MANPISRAWANNNATPTWTRPWTIVVPLKHTDERVYEYRCHEGNSGLEYILKGARAEEQSARK